ncbi:hypothetical protein UFOVP317_12 [uncultured Caudovirales phage]|uniref:Uncharacterized protein n=1 Tax=uncultured Caudovirales phage TaxID=2100421 RepID=A0A6J5LRD8_9CAUD|nr:hypothetical protein UFOVP317_12 [uncultured Caudovirales phage]
MMKFLTALLRLLDRLFGLFEQRRWEQQGREKTIKEMNDEINRQIELGEAAISVPDFERSERLRNRFDRSRTDK